MDIAIIGGCLARGSAALAAAGVDAPAREARLLLAHHTGLEPAALLAFPERSVADPAGYGALVARRAAREPMAHITGWREFYGLRLRITADVLVPRPDSETVVEAALAALRAGGWRDGAPARVLDVGTGSGCLLLALLSAAPGLTGVGTDVSQSALEVAAGNAARLGLSGRCGFVRARWLEGLSPESRFDLIVSNPPYIPAGEVNALQPEVSRWEPRLALDGGRDGLDAYRTLIPAAAARLSPGGALAVEVGAGQAPAVMAIARAAGLKNIRATPDLSGVERCVAGLR